MQMLAETTTAAFRKKNERCFTYGDKNRLKRDCPRYCKEMHWAKDCKSKFDIEGKSIPGISKQGTPPGPLQQKPGANSIFSLKPSTSGSAAIDIPALNDFFLYP